MKILILIAMLIPALACAAPPPGVGPLNAAQKPRNAEDVPANTPMCFMMTAVTWLPNGQEQQAGPMSCARCGELLTSTKSIEHSCDQTGRCADTPVARRCVPVGSVPTSSGN